MMAMVEQMQGTWCKQMRSKYTIDLELLLTLGVLIHRSLVLNVAYVFILCFDDR